MCAGDSYLVEQAGVASGTDAPHLTYSRHQRDNVPIFYKDKLPGRMLPVLLPRRRLRVYPARPVGA